MGFTVIGECRAIFSSSCQHCFHLKFLAGYSAFKLNIFFNSYSRILACVRISQLSTRARQTFRSRHQDGESFIRYLELKSLLSRAYLALFTSVLCRWTSLTFAWHLHCMLMMWYFWLRLRGRTRETNAGLVPTGEQKERAGQEAGRIKFTVSKLLSGPIYGAVC